MVKFSALINRFKEQGEKTGWTYIDIPIEIAQKLKPGNKKSFRVKGSVDAYSFESIALLPMGGGNFIMTINAAMRKGISKRKGAMVAVEMEPDNRPVAINADLIKCLADEPAALSFFNELTPGHKKYFSNWIESAKTEHTRATRIAQTIKAMIRKQSFGVMARELKAERKYLAGL